MSYAPMRSLCGELCEGSTDGSVRKGTPNRGGFPEDTSQRDRERLDYTQYGDVAHPMADYVHYKPAHLDCPTN